MRNSVIERTGATKRGGKQVCKPGSVESGHPSGTEVAFRLKQPYPRTRRAASSSSYLALLRVGFTWPAGHPAAGGLLHRLFTLTLFHWRAPQTVSSGGHALDTKRRRGEGGMFLWHFP